MKAYTTEELNKELDKPCWVDEKLARVNREKMIGWMIANGHRKQDKPFGKPYASKSGAVAVFINEKTAFGFTSNDKWFSVDNFTEFFTDFWQPYPQEKWEAMLINECLNRFKAGSSVKSIDEKGAAVFVVSTKEWAKPQKNNWYSGIFYWGYGNDIYVMGEGQTRGYKIFDSKTGVWAEIIEVEEPKYTHAEWCEKMKQVKLC